MRTEKTFGPFLFSVSLSERKETKDREENWHII